MLDVKSMRSKGLQTIGIRKPEDHVWSKTDVDNTNVSRARL